MVTSQEIASRLAKAREPIQETKMEEKEEIISDNEGSIIEEDIDED